VKKVAVLVEMSVVLWVVSWVVDLVDEMAGMSVAVLVFHWDEMKVALMVDHLDD